MKTSAFSFLPQPAVLACAMAVANISAVSANTDNREKMPLLEEVIVSATLTEQTVFETLGAATVFTQSDILLRQPQDLGDLLRQSAGADITRTGSRGSAPSLFTRGTDSDHTLFLVNGLRISSATLGSSAFQVIDPELLQSVEYMKGASSVLFGSEALGGVIQLNTLLPSVESGAQFQGRALYESGTQQQQRGLVTLAGQENNVSYALGAAYRESDGIDSLVNDDGFNADTDGFHQTNATGTLGYQFNERVSLSVSHFLANLQNEYDNDFNAASQPYNISQLSVTGINLSAAFFENITSELSLGLSKNKSRNLDRQGVNPVSFFDTQRESIFWKNSAQLNAQNRLTLGMDYFQESIDSTTEYIDIRSGDAEVIEQRDNKAIFVQHQYDTSRIDVTLGLRREDNRSFGMKTTGSSAIGLALNDNHRVYASWATGFKIPTFNDLYWPTAGSPDLLPETSKNTELGYKGRSEHVYYTAAMFENTLNNLIEWAPTAANPAIWAPSNVDRANIQGLELSLGGDWEQFYGNVSMTFLDTLNESTGKPLNNRAERFAFVDVGYRFDRATLGLNSQLSDQRQTNTEERLGGFALFGVYADMTLGKSFSLRASIDNLFDKHYLLNRQYNTYGRNGNIKLNVRF